MFVQVISALPEKRSDVEHALISCRQYLEDLEELSVWCIATRDYLQKVQDDREEQGLNEKTAASLKVKYTVISRASAHG